VDFGGTRIKAGLVREGTILKTAAVDTPAGESPDQVVASIVHAVEQLQVCPHSVGLAIPGQVDYYGMIWRLPNVPGLEAFPIAESIGRRLGCNVVAENDATTAALGENLWGRGRGFADFMMVTLGTGIGGGLIANNKLVRGAHGFAGEIGHIKIDRSPEAWECNCGQRGCAEAYAGTKGLVRRFRELGGEATTIREIAESARRREPAGLQVFQQMGETLGLLLTNIQHVLDLEAFAFTGGIAQSFDLIEPSLRKTLRSRAFAPPLGQVPLLVSQLGARAGLVGAAYLPMMRESVARDLNADIPLPSVTDPTPWMRR
jgi:glucokinase